MFAASSLFHCVAPYTLGFIIDIEIVGRNYVNKRPNDKENECEVVAVACTSESKMSLERKALLPDPTSSP